MTISIPKNVDAFIRENASPRKMGDFVAECVRLRMLPGKEGIWERLTKEIERNAAKLEAME
jgi:hypothetical protein